jgi:KipI family sensor histidine kinase inhibitor
VTEEPAGPHEDDAADEPAVRVLASGPDALLAEVASTAAATELYAAARSSLPAGLAAVDVVPGARTVLFDGVPDLAGLRWWLAGWRPGAEPDLGTGESGAGGAVELPTTYDGADLADVARRWGMTRAEAVATHAGLTFTVAFCGFAPGFAYCSGLPEELAVPRLAEPRARVPAGSVGLADLFTGVYPTASPGGWRLLGRTGTTLWDPAADPPALLAPGTRVRFLPEPADR